MMMLNGGSASLVSAPDNSSFDNGFISLPKLSMFKVDGLYPTFPKTSNPITGVILPAFDSSLSVADTARLGSVMPYRDIAVKGKDGRPAFNSWFVSLGYRPEGSKFTKGGIYRYFGRSKSTFVSPSTVNLPDPIIDMAIWIRVQKKKYNDTTWMHLIERPVYNPNTPGDTKPMALPNPQMCIMMNAYCTGSNPHDENKDTMENRVLVVTETSFMAMVDDLNKQTPSGMAPIDSNFPLFMLGDITNPAAAMQFKTEKRESNITWVYLNFGTAVTDYSTNVTMFQGSQVQVSQDILDKRYDLANTDSFIRIPTYDEIVMQMLVEGLVPREAMLAAGINKKCQHFPSDDEVQAHIEEWNQRNAASKEASATTAPVQQPVAMPAPVQPTTPVMQPVAAQPVQYQQPVMPQTVVQQPVMQQPVVQQPVQQYTQQPQYQQPDPAAIFTTASNATSRVPAHTPAPAPVQQPQAPSMSQTYANSLTPEELAEFQRLEQKAQTDPTSMTTDDFNKLATFVARKQN